MDLKDAEKQIDNADSFLDKLWKFLGKHWGKLIILLLAYATYKFCVLVGEEMDKPVIEEVQTLPEATLVSEYYLVYDNGDSALIRTWDDGIVDTIAINY